MFLKFCDAGKPFMIVRSIYYTYLKLFENRNVSYNFIIIIIHLIRKYIILNLLNVAIMLIIYCDNNDLCNTILLLLFNTYKNTNIFSSDSILHTVLEILYLYLLWF